MQTKQLDDVITQAEAARLRGVTIAAIADLMKRERLSVVEIAGRKHVLRSEVLAFKELPTGRPKKASKTTAKKHRMKKSSLVTENYGGEDYKYYPLGKYVVAAPGVCGGRPTMKYTRLDARHVIGMLERGETPEEIAARHEFPVAAVKEAVRLAKVYDYERSYAK